MSHQPNSVASDDRVGPHFAGYWLEALVGVDGMGKLFRGVAGDGAPVALKRVKADLARDQIVRRRSGREAAIAQTVHNPHVVAVLDHGLHLTGADPFRLGDWCAHVYSLACVVFEALVAGRRLGIATACASSGLICKRIQRSELAPEIGQTLKAALHEDPRRRRQTSVGFARSLARAAGITDPDPTP